MFNISPSLNSNKVFILRKSEVEKRWDPSWYLYLLSVKGFKSKKVSLKNLLLENPQYGANEIGIERKTNTEPRYIRITDINDFGELENVLGKTALNIEEKYFLHDNDLLLARSGNTVGKAYLHKKADYDCFFAGYLIRFKLDQSKVLPEYIFTYTQTDFYKKWTKAIQRSTGQPNINAEEYRSLEIPLPDKTTQIKISKIYFDFIAQKQKNEAAADKLLAGIDDYLLNELGIKLPEPPENLLGNRIFISSHSQLTNTRFDPYHHQKSFIVTLEAILNSKFRVEYLKHFITDLKNGVEIRTYVEKGGLRYLRVSDLGKNGLNSNSPRYVEFQDIPDRIKLNPNCILISRSGSLGLVNVYTDEIENAILSSHIFKVELNTNVLNPIYLEAYLRSKIGQTEIFRNNNGGVIPEINQDALKSIHIVIPPIDKQKEIASHITFIRQQALKLRNRTTELLENGKKEIEDILLG